MNRWAAACAVLLFVAQAALLAFSTGASAVARDRFGNVICTADAPGRHGGSPGDRHASGLECCTVACPMLGGWKPGAAWAVPASNRTFASDLAFAFHENDRAAGVPASPRQARAPPARV